MRFAIFFSLVILGFQHLSAQGESLFDDSFLHEIRFIGMDTTIIDGQKIYQMASMLVDGVSIDSIGVKDKGNISNNVPNKKLPLKIKTNKYVSGKKYDGIKEFTLHNNYQDPSMMREKLTYDLARQLGLYSLRTAFAKVYINDSYWGLYTIVEGKDEFYKQQFDHRDADAIESIDLGNMCYISDNPDDYNYDVSGLPNYILENGQSSSAFQRFAKMIDKANNTPDADYFSEVSNYLNLEDFFKYQASNVYLMNFDSYIGFRGNQIYMYDTIANIWQVIPWDFNASLNLWDDGGGIQYANAYPIFPDKITNGCIAGKLNTVPELKNFYLNSMCDLVNNYAEPTTINSKIDFFKNQIESAVYSDWRKVYSNQEFDETTGYGKFIIDFNEFEGLKTFFEERHELVKQSLLDEGFTCTSTSVVSNIKKELNLEFFPNPSTGFLNLKQDYRVQQISIYNLQGRELRQINEPDFPVVINDLEIGMYLISVTLEDQVVTSKIILE